MSLETLSELAINNVVNVSTSKAYYQEAFSAYFNLPGSQIKVDVGYSSSDIAAINYIQTDTVSYNLPDGKDATDSDRNYLSDPSKYPSKIQASLVNTTPIKISNSPSNTAYGSITGVPTVSATTAVSDNLLTINEKNAVFSCTNTEGSIMDNLIYIDKLELVAINYSETATGSGLYRAYYSPMLTRISELKANATNFLKRIISEYDGANYNKISFNDLLYTIIGPVLLIDQTKVGRGDNLYISGFFYTGRYVSDLTDGGSSSGGGGTSTALIRNDTVVWSAIDSKFISSTSTDDPYILHAGDVYLVGKPSETVTPSTEKRIGV